MKLGPNAINKMYPHLTGVTCEEHGEQSRAKVPDHLQAVFASREDPRWACSACVKAAKEQWATHQADLRRKRDEEKKAYRASIKEARELARNADRTLVGYVSKCKNAVETVKNPEVALEQTRTKMTVARNKATGALQRLEKAQKEYDAYEKSILILSELSLDQFEELEKADSDVGVCYNELRDKLNEANALWDELGKSAKKKRDKTNRKAALELLREHEQAQRDDERGEQATGEVQRSGEQSLSE
jgi:hypothetical protein